MKLQFIGYILAYLLRNLITSVLLAKYCSYEFQFLNHFAMVYVLELTKSCESHAGGQNRQTAREQVDWKTLAAIRRRREHDQSLK